jgi:hypothetical protein
MDTKISAQSVLLQLAEGFELFHTPQDECFADIVVDGRRRTYDLNEIKALLNHAYFRQTAAAPSREAINAVICTLAAKAKIDGPERDVHCRAAEHDGGLFLNLGDPGVVEITPGSWRLVSDPPVRFHTTRATLPLPIPQDGGSIDDLRPFLNVPDDNQFVLVVAFQLAALRARGPYPVLSVSGPQGSAKSSFSRIVRDTIDPHQPSLTQLPATSLDLYLQAKNAHILAFDNLEPIRDVASDNLCRLATGSGFSTRRLHTADCELVFDVSRPIIVNGIEEVVGRPDLADRSIFATLQQLEQPRPERELRQEFQRLQPKILGALLNACAHGLAALPSANGGRFPRMADFAQFARACETKFWPIGTFDEAYKANRLQAAENIVEADPVSSLVCELMRTENRVATTATQLLSSLAKLPGGTGRKLPKSPSRLSAHLKRVQATLRGVGIEITFEREGHQGQRLLVLTRL